METIVISAVLLVGFAALAGLLLWKLPRRHDDRSLTLLQNQVQATVAQIGLLRHYELPSE